MSARKDLEATLQKLDTIIEAAMNEYKNSYDAKDKGRFLVIALKATLNRAKITKHIMGR